jgi:hypothetical protein
MTTMEPFEEIQNHFKEREDYLALKKLELKEKLTPILAISECTEYQNEEFDWFGDDDLLKLNFGGRNVDIKRSVLTKPKFGWNLFSRLFDKRWDAFHVRDKNGRIYVDLKEEWMRPLIDSMKYNETGEAPISPCNLYLRRSVSLFNESSEFTFPTLKFSINGQVVSGDGAAIFPSLLLAFNLRNSYWDIYSYLKPQEAQFHLVYSSYFRTASPPKPMDMRFKTLAYIISTSDQPAFTYILFLRDGESSINGYDYKTGSERTFLPPEQKNISHNLLSVFPIPFTGPDSKKRYIFLKTDPDRKAWDLFCDKLEVYEVKFSYHQIIPPCCLPVQKNMLQMSICNNVETAPEKSIHESVIKLLGSLNRRLAADRKEIHFVEQILLNFDRELEFMANYFHRGWLTEDCSCSSTLSEKLKLLEQVISAKRSQGEMFTWEGGQSLHDSYSNSHGVPLVGGVTSLKSQRKRKREDTDCLDPIVYFNVEGEVIPILRSTILRVIPGSQLAVRVSGRWEENQKDRDEEGNLIVNCHKESFKNILSSLQINPWKKDPLEIYVNELSRDMIEETLDYLMINPNSIRLIDRTY